MKTLHKYKLTHGAYTYTCTSVQISMPEGAKLLTVQDRHGHICLWAQVDMSRPHVMRTFDVAGTGHALNADAGDYIGTVQAMGGALVLRVFETTRLKGGT